MKLAEQNQLELLIKEIEELSNEKNGRYTPEEKEKLVHAVNYLKLYAESKERNILLKGIGHFIRAFLIHKLFEDD